MSKFFDRDKPIYLQVREKIEDQIINQQLLEGEQAPSTNQLVNFYKINHATVSKIEMGDFLTAEVVKQFPEKFKD